MSSTTSISVSEYLNSSYSPDRDVVDGRVEDCFQSFLPKLDDNSKQALTSCVLPSLQTFTAT
jgi:hypothetical protein